MQSQEWIRDRDQKRAWDAYRWDMSMIDPINVLPISDPVQNKICSHIYEKATIVEKIQESVDGNFYMACPGKFDPSWMVLNKYEVDRYDKYEMYVRPWSGCINDILALEDLEPHPQLKAEIERRKIKRIEDINNNHEVRGDIYRIAQSKKFTSGTNWNESNDPYKRVEYLP